MHDSPELFVRRHALSARLLAASVLLASSAEARWEQRNSGTLSALTAVQCLSATDAWAAGVGGTVLHSTDGGDTWVSVDSGVDSAYGWNSLHFLNSQVGWFSGLKSTSRTLDAGSSWYRIYLPDLSDPGIPSQNAIFAVSETEAWTVGVSYGDVGGGHVVDLLTLWDHKKTDSGMTVGQIQLLAQGVFSDVQFLTPDDGFAIGYTGEPEPDGIIARISNATTDPSFSKQDSGGGFYLEGISMLNTMRGFIVGDDGVILHTSDGGDTWLAQQSPTTADLWDVFFLDAAHGWAVGAGTVLETTDGGVHWEAFDDAPQALFTGVHFCDADHGFVVGDGGALLRWVAPRCGDDSVDAGEACDLGSELNGAAGACCTSACAIVAGGTLCRKHAGACDAPEQCDGVHAECPADEVLPAMTPCRPAVDECDVAEVCDGKKPACPADRAAPEGTLCDDGDPCTVGETCGTRGCGLGKPKCSDGSCEGGLCAPREGDAGSGNTEQAGAPGNGPPSAGGEGNDAGAAAGGAAGERGSGDSGTRSGGTGGSSAGSGGKTGAGGSPGGATHDSGGCHIGPAKGRADSQPWPVLILAGLASMLAARRRALLRRPCSDARTFVARPSTRGR